MSDFQHMSIGQLKAYLKSNQGDTEAFHVLMDKLNANPNPEIYSASEIEKLGELINSKTNINNANAGEKMVSLKELIEKPEVTRASDPEEQYTTSGISWESYEALLVELEDNSHYRITYLDGILEIVSPSRKHETTKSRIRSLVEFYLFKKQIRHTPMGSTTVKNRLKKAGAEPDECYCIGEEKDIPDLAIEVIITSGSIKKLETYRRLGVKEVWFWENIQLKLFHLREETPKEFAQTYGYEEIRTSELIQALDIIFLTECILIPDHLQALNEFEQGI
ncbi:MAG: Uma2 family endonuclease [Cyanobacteriota bacterium]|nr:Uma2 family endonuclease [Cyanobacteriota bacterium]